MNKPVRIQEADFSLEEEVNALRQTSQRMGG
ncbi:MAG TPA: molybdenum cofactor biosynthesis protein MoaE, partial [Ghiorsea sp.]|nr:molybdenum cofactor biosynthesis protein MoaE [Ghiorsea sp.]